MKENMEKKLSSEEREKLIDELIDEDIQLISRDILSYGDTSFLACILHGGGGWKQYCYLSDEEIQIEYEEMKGEDEE